MHSYNFVIFVFSFLLKRKQFGWFTPTEQLVITSKKRKNSEISDHNPKKKTVY